MENLETKIAELQEKTNVLKQTPNDDALAFLGALCGTLAAEKEVLELLESERISLREELDACKEELNAIKAAVEEIED